MNGDGKFIDSDLNETKSTEENKKTQTQTSHQPNLKETDSQKLKRVITIGICGGTGAGKTTLAQSLYAQLGKEKNVTYLVHDDYYRDLSAVKIEERANKNFDHPDSLETDLLVQNIIDLKAGNSVEVPKYDFTTHTRKDRSEFVIAHPKKVIILEGILILSHQRLVNLLDVKVFVDAHSDVRLMRRMIRDTRERGRSMQQVIDQYGTTVKPMHDEYVEPSKLAADIIVHSDSNFHSGEVAVQLLVNHVKMLSLPTVL